ncbi:MULTISPECIES: aspartate-alanine antiporter-like transporter [Acetobacteraceae]|uniref:Putative transport protein n=1 Tax=Parasaccharibacter apium TaxID=1510841 RepID=A0A7U7G6V5_9PROT|nr:MULTISPECIES: hypothetical protein [Acetobacteraceae]MCQ0041656.1 hypothetical protein [Bombella sp.]MUG79058.1 hypothetical protein [Bombella sp. ESL0380]MUH02370.1 hypothetical protein [Bombella sp. ESL0387]POS64120.1 hypothetical protein ASO19_03075 [Parasaccharibacter apium]POS64462.1 hypothetical protein ASQ43_03965 [Parasaccharibacter apium]
MFQRLFHGLSHLFGENPELAFFLSVGFGFLIGRIRIGVFQLGGVAGSLLMAVLISQFGVHVGSSLRTVLFILFIYAVGYRSGPNFFRSLGRQSLREVALAVIMAISAFGTVIGVARLFHLDKGIAAGLAAGGLTQSAIIGTASSALEKLGLPLAQVQQMQADVAVGYAVTYIFGSIGTIIFCATILPLCMRRNLRDDALKAESLPEDATEDTLPAVQNGTVQRTAVPVTTDLVYNMLGMALGLLFGLVVVHLGGVPITLGSGGGALLSGLLFGWWHGRHPGYGAMPSSVCLLWGSFGLAGFVAVTGLQTGGQVVAIITRQGGTILLLGMIVTIVPLVITALVGRFLLGYRNVALFAGALAGTRSSNPAFGEVLAKAGHGSPTVPFAITYAVANVLLTLLGPLIVAFV